MSIFDEQAIEAAARAVGDNTSCDVPKGCPICTDIAQAALEAAVLSLRERGKLIEDGEWWAGKTPDYKGPVAIIRMEPKP